MLINAQLVPCCQERGRESKQFNFLYAIIEGSVAFCSVNSMYNNWVSFFYFFSLSSWFRLRLIRLRYTQNLIEIQIRTDFLFLSDGNRSKINAIVVSCRHYSSRKLLWLVRRGAVVWCSVQGEDLPRFSYFLELQKLRSSESKSIGSVGSLFSRKLIFHSATAKRLHFIASPLSPARSLPLERQ